MYGFLHMKLKGKIANFTEKGKKNDFCVTPTSHTDPLFSGLKVLKFNNLCCYYIAIYIHV